MAARAATAGLPGPMSHCGPDPAIARLWVRHPTRGAAMFKPRFITLGVALAVGAAALAAAPLASAKGGDGVKVSGVCTKSSTVEAQAEPRGSRHRGRVRGRPESQRRPVEGHAAPQRLARRLDDRDHPRPQRLLLVRPRDLGHARQGRRRRHPLGRALLRHRHHLIRANRAGDRRTRRSSACRAQGPS